MSYTITANPKYNSLEISFTEKPAEEIRNSLKELKFRWNAAKKIWYGFSTEEEIKRALGGETISPRANAETINLNNLGQNAPCLHGAELAGAIREDLKKRGVKGCTVRSRRATHDTAITVTVSASEKDFTSIEEFQERYTFSHFTVDVESYGRFTGARWCYSLENMTEEEKQKEYDGYARYEIEHRHSYNEYHRERKNYPQYTTAFCEKLDAVYQIADQWNYDNSDSQSDYFDVGYYLDIEIKVPEFTAREKMTEDEKGVLVEERRKEDEERAAWLARYEQEQKEREEAARVYEAQRKKDREIILNTVSVVDLAEDEQIYITGLAGGIGKECNFEELNESIKDHDLREDALITRKVIFGTEDALKLFENYLLDDFDFLEGMGGTATEDLRLEGVNLYTLTAEQRESVKMYLCNCVGIYLNNELVLVSDPEGYNYSRYTFIPTEESEIKSALTETENQKRASEEKEPFYFPAPLAVQVQNIKPGERVTVLKTDGWLTTNIFDSFGVVESVTAGKYAQYDGFYINYEGGRRSFLRDSKKTLVYSGYLAPLPDYLTKRKINEHLSELLGENDLFKAALNYYEKKPLVDTIQR